MHWRIGLLGIGLVSALVVGGIAEQPPYYGSSEDPVQHPVQPGVPPHQVSMSPGDAQMPLGATENGPQVGSAGELIGFNGFDGSGSQTITLVHTGKMQIAVYHIDRSGQIHLRSSRPIDEDFSFSLNLTAPLPSQIRLLGGQVK